MKHLTSRLSSLLHLSTATFSMLTILLLPAISHAQQHPNVGGPDHEYVCAHTDSIPNFGKVQMYGHQLEDVFIRFAKEVR